MCELDAPNSPSQETTDKVPHLHSGVKVMSAAGSCGARGCFTRQWCGVGVDGADRGGHSLLVSFSCWFLLSWQPHRIFQRSASDSAPEVRLPFLCAVQTLPGVLLHCWQVMGSMTSSPHHRRHRRAEREQLSLLSNQRSSFVSSVAVPSHGSLTRSSSQCRRSPYPEETTSSFTAFQTQTHPKNSDSEEI